jgi:hypothetical protein
MMVQYVFATLEGVKIPVGASIYFIDERGYIADAPVNMLREHDRCLLRGCGVYCRLQDTATFHGMCNLYRFVLSPRKYDKITTHECRNIAWETFVRSIEVVIHNARL